MNKLRVVLPENTGGILAAVSGGADSVAMLCLLREVCREHSVRLTAAHFEHGIRAEASVADAAFVRELCRAWNVELIEGSADVPAMAKARSVGIEEAARDARYAFLREAKRQAGADWIALAHHQDDQAETVLMHLLRGCGLKGLVGMRETEGDLYRPLLSYPKQTLVDFLRNQGIEWREDASNQVSDTPRNALRLNVIPQMETCYPAAKRAI
jgi:tRNA(Ile)-lysidine synthase